MPSSGPPAIKSLNMQTIKSYGNLARTNLYQVDILSVGVPLTGNVGQTFSEHLSSVQRYGVTDFSGGFQNTLSFLCAEATLPSSSYATAEVKDNFMGVSQEFAHTRINTDIDFTFYVDREYKVLMFFEAWMDYISGGNNPQLNEPPLDDTQYINSYYRRMKYPKQYKTSEFFIKKFERDYQTSLATNISYRLINAFPKSMTSIPLAYGEAEIMKVTVTMNYDRYIPEREYADVLTDQQEFEQNLANATGGGSLSGAGTIQDLNATNAILGQA